MAGPTYLIDVTISFFVKYHPCKSQMRFEIYKDRLLGIIIPGQVAIRHADEIIVLQKGKIVERGTHDSLMVQDGFYKKLVDMQEVR